MSTINDAWQRGTFPRRLRAWTASSRSTTHRPARGARRDIGRDRAARGPV